MTKKGECVWKMTYLVLVPPVLQVLSRVFQELILLLSLVKLKFKILTDQVKRLDFGDNVAILCPCGLHKWRCLPAACSQYGRRLMLTIQAQLIQETE